MEALRKSGSGPDTIWQMIRGYVSTEARFLHEPPRFA